MARRKKDDGKPALGDEMRARFRKVTLFALGAMALAALCGLGIFKVYQYVDKNVATVTEPPRVVLANRPVWMSDFLVEQISNLAKPPGGYSALNNQMLKDVKARLENNLRSNAWIRQVRQLRLEYDKRPGDTLIIDCDFRVPAALVHCEDFYYFVDNDAFQLPERYPAEYLPKVMYGPDGKLQFRIIEGVRGGPPMPGQRFAGDDLAAALDMVKLLYGNDFTEDIVKVDVSNFGKRQDEREAQIVLYTRFNTQIRWGRPATSTDLLAEVPTGQKMEYLQRAYLKYGRPDGGLSWLDLRKDKAEGPESEIHQMASSQK
jgi:hypothetical protein